jgi:two-component system, NtrC family, sensor kinase
MISNYLRDCSRLTEASWAIWLTFETPEWVIRDYHGLNQRMLALCLSWIRQLPGSNWLNKSRTSPSQRVRSRLVEDPRMGCSWLYVFPSEKEGSLIIVGTGVLGAAARRIWRLAAYNLGQIESGQALEQELQNTRQELQARIAAQAAAEQRLIQAAKLAAVGEMAAGVAHELNNPLTTIVGFTELVLEDLAPTSPSRADLETVLHEALRARDVVRHLLDFSRRSDLVRSKGDVNEILLDTLSLMRHLLGNRGVQVHTHLQDSLPWVYLDRDQFKQVILNLLHNSLNAMPGGGHIDIDTHSKTKYGTEWVTMTVKDTGVGISPEHLERIFEPFFTTRAADGGTGLGLAVTYGIVASHGGRIEVESAPDAGASFTVWLPVEVSSQ